MNGFMLRYLSDGTRLPQITAGVKAKERERLTSVTGVFPKSYNATRHPPIMDPTAESQPSSDQSRNPSGLKTTARGDDCKDMLGGKKMSWTMAHSSEMWACV